MWQVFRTVYAYVFPHERNNHRPHVFSAVSIALLVAMVIVFEAGYVVQTKVVFLRTDFLAAVLPSVLTVLTNESRTANGIAPVEHDDQLSAAAQLAAEDMASKGYFSHRSPEGKTAWYWLNRVGYTYQYAGQNLAVHFTDSEAVETAWLESPTHRMNILKREYTRVGFGTANGIYEGKETTFVVEYFATPEVVRTLSETQGLLPVKVAASSTAINITSYEGSTALAASAVLPSAQVSWSAKILLSPWSALMKVSLAILGLVAFSFFVTVFLRGRKSHWSVYVSTALLCVLIGGALFWAANVTKLTIL